MTSRVGNEEPDTRPTGMRVPLVLCLGLLAAGPAHADATRDALIEMTKCAEIVDSTERLKCFDAAVPHAKNALSAPAPQAKEKSLLDWFGFGRPTAPVTKPEDFGKPAPEPAAGSAEEITAIKATVIEFARTLRGKCLFVLDNGQVWRQLDADSTPVRDPEEGSTLRVTIETGVLNSYNLTIEGRNAMIKVMRLK
ncbi:MAG TPA: hypothetical protein VL742_20990 [Casimicrobiaceae bacterium]|nr:hypothetical protein [Casimicrobiaceae bacterium]